MLYLKKCAKSLGKHCVGICNYAKHKLTSARIEAGNVSIGMIRKRARGIRDTGYFKLKIRQSSLPDNQSMFYLKTWNHSTKRRRARIRNDILHKQTLKDKSALEHAMADIKFLEGTLPVCSFCKKIRDDENEWNPMETYISRHSGVEFSHGLCPDCGKEHYPDYLK